MAASRSGLAQAEGSWNEVVRGHDFEHVVFDRRQVEPFLQHLGLQARGNLEGRHDAEELLATVLGAEARELPQVIEELVDGVGAAGS